MTIRYTKKNSVSYKCAKTDQRGRHEPVNKTSYEMRQNVFTFIMKLPAVPSHYCRNKTTRKYLPTEFRNITFLYGIFKKDQISNGKNIFVSLKVFRDIFKKEFNIGFHLPKKDKCGLCEYRKDKDYQETKKSKQKYEEHLRNKNICKNVFLADQKKSLKDPTFLCVSFDLQKVLNTPHGDNLLLYYARKYAYYNLTVYENITQNAHCYLWGECDGGRGCNEICTIMFKYLQEVDQRKSIEHISLNCDSCFGQNKNKAMLIMIYDFLNKSTNIKSIKITYLLPGHTYMPVDSIHGTIERFIRKRIIWAPSEWSTIITNARTNPRPLKTVKMNYTDFVDWKQMSAEILKQQKFKSLDGESIQISKLRSAFFEKDNSHVVIDYSYDSTNLKTVKINMPKKFQNKKPKRLFTQKLCIAVQKKKDLETLCTKNVIPTKYQQEYIEMKTSNSLPDVLPETDIEDSEQED